MTLTARATRARTATARSLIGQKYNLKGPSIIWHYDATSTRLGVNINHRIAYLYDGNDSNDDNEKGWTIVALQSIAHTGFWTISLTKIIKGERKHITLDDYYLEGELPPPPDEGIKIWLGGNFQYGYTWNGTANLITLMNIRYWQQHLQEMTKKSASRKLLPCDAWENHPDNVAATNLKKKAIEQYKASVVASRKDWSCKKIEVESSTEKLDYPPCKRKFDAKGAENARRNARNKTYQPLPIKRGFRGRRKVRGRPLLPIGEE